MIWILLLLGIVGCARHKLFYQKRIRNILICDTIYNENLRKGYLALTIFQSGTGTPTQIMGQNYYQYGLSTTNEVSPVMFCLKNEIIYLVSKKALLKNNYELESFIDLNAKVGDSWDLSQGGLLGNSHYLLDSVDKSKGLFYLSRKNIIEIDDAIVPYQMVISKKNGIEQIRLRLHGDSTVCKCNM
jgi:hypothetical protein